MSSEPESLAYTHRPQRYRGRSQPDESTVPGVRLVDRICILMAELGNDALYPIKVPGGERFANETFKLEGTALALVVELVVQSFRDVWVHDAICRGFLHGGATARCYWSRRWDTGIRTGGGARGRCRGVLVGDLLEVMVVVLLLLHA